MVRSTLSKDMSIRRALLALLALAIVGVLLALPSGSADAATTFTVNKTGDAGDKKINGVCDSSRLRGRQCTLRAAIQEANDLTVNPGLDTINFNIGGTNSVKTISPASPLPEITDSVTIDGYTQRGSSENSSGVGNSNNAILKVQLNGTNAGTNANPSPNGLVISASNSTIKGLVINRFGPNSTDSIAVLIGPGTTGNKVEGNYIGTNASGTQALSNGFAGVFIASASTNTVGGTSLAARNVISGNRFNGVVINGLVGSATGNKVEGNLIGTTANGSGDLGNGERGVSIQQSANDNTIGGTASPAGNVISGNGAGGVEIIGDSEGNKVEGNYIGTTADGGSPLGNGEGVSIGAASGNTIGGTASGATNRIAHNSSDGIRASIRGTGNSILSNEIYQNGAVGIDLQGTNDVTENDPGDPDTGVNNLQNFPVITSATRDSTTGITTITGTLNSNASQTYTIQCFLADNDSSNHGEGQTLVDTTTTTTGAGGDSPTFTCTAAPNELSINTEVTATATNTSGTAANTTIGDTSEFSQNFPVTSSM